MTFLSMDLLVSKTHKNPCSQIILATTCSHTLIFPFLRTAIVFAYNLFLFSNLNQIIQVNATADRMKVVELHEGEIPSFNFTYSVTWVDTSYPFTRRMDLYKNTFFGQEMEIHWLSIVNSIVLVVLLTG